MLYKFVGGEPANTLEVFRSIAETGSLKFSSPATFNDPFEFKFVSTPPSSREIFDDWHRRYATDRTPAELDHAWESFAGPAADWNTSMTPRHNLAEASRVLCLARRYNSALMWSHYTREYTGCCVEIDQQIVDVLSTRPGFEACEPVVYASQPPTLRWFEDSPDEAVRKVTLFKHRAWAYERETRAILVRERAGPHIFEQIPPDLIRGVIFGARAGPELTAAALAVQAARPGFRIRQVISAPKSYRVGSIDVRAGVQRLTHML